MRLFCLFALAGILLVGAGCDRSPRGRDGVAGVLLIVIDTLRADHLGAWGYPHPTSPQLDELAARGTRYRAAMTPVPVTLPAVASLLTGRLPLAHGVRDNEGFVLPGSEHTLAERFREAGWRTAAVLGSAVLSADRGLHQGFEIYDDGFAGEYPVYEPALAAFAAEFAATRRRADVVTNRALEILEQFDDERFFLLVHYFDVHSYYDPPPPHRDLHPGRPYDGEIAFVDAQLGRLFEALGPEVLIVVVSDHGEGLGEHGETEHGFLLYESTLHVPIVFAGPSLPAASHDVPVSLVDVEPTIAQLCGLPPVSSPRDGVALDLEASPARGRALYAETLRTLVSYGWSELRALRREELKLIRSRTDVELYDLRADPREGIDLGGGRAAADSLLMLLEELVGDEDPESYRRAARQRAASEIERAAELRSLGYVAGGDAVDDVEDVERPHPREQLPIWTARQLSRSRLRAALELQRAERWAASLELLDSLAQEPPKRIEVLYPRAQARQELGDLQGAESDLRAVLVIDPLHPPALRALSEQLVRSNRIEQAHGLLQRWVRVEPEDADARYNLGVAAHRLGRTDEARHQLERFLEIAPEDFRARAVAQLLQSLPPAQREETPEGQP